MLLIGTGHIFLSLSEWQRAHFKMVLTSSHLIQMEIICFPFFFVFSRATHVAYGVPGLGVELEL